MKKFLSILIVGLFVLSGLGAVAFPNGKDISTDHQIISISSPIINEIDGYVTIDVKESTSMIMSTGKPMLPVFSKTYIYPVGTQIEDVQVSMDTVKTTVNQIVHPAPKPVALTTEDIDAADVEIRPDDCIYQSNSLYPSQSYQVRSGIGIDHDERVLFVNVDCYAQYLPSQNVVYTPENIDISVSYKLPEIDYFSNDEYDMLIITDENFIDDMQPLVDHKNDLGIRTIMETTQDIYGQYNGRDEQEDIKLRIFDAVMDEGITYVLLAGGRIGQTDKWYVPERVVTNDDDSDYETGYASDLYYADVIKKNQYGIPEFENWDSDGDGLYAESYAMGFSYRIEDKIDYYPDVYLGRLPFRYSWEPEIIVNKIIDYELGTNENDSWFRSVLLAGGDTSPPARGNVDEGVYEGEISTGLTGQYLGADGFNVEKLYTSLGNFNKVSDFIDKVNPGNGFIHVAGHGNPAVWGNFYPDAESEEEFAYGFTIIDIRKFTNGNKLPIIVIGGCHNGQFNSTMQQLVESVDSGDFTGIGRLEWVPHDTCSWWMLQEGGGSIASIGNTGLGYGYINSYCTQGLGGWLNPQFFIVYSQHKNNDILGQVHAQALTNYINEEAPAIDGVNKDGIDRKTIEEWVLLGDPSLKIGGYAQNTFGDSDDEDDEDDENEPTPSASENAPIWEIGDEWIYRLNNIDFVFSEIEGRDVNIQFSAGDISLSVVDETSETYICEISTDDIDVSLDIFFDWFIEGKDPIDLELVFSDAILTGEIIFEKDTLGIKTVDVKLTIVFDSTELPIELPDFITNLVKTIPVDINLNLEFDESLPIIDFPIETGKQWGIPATMVTINGNVDSIWLKIANIVNRILKLVGMDFIPESLAKYLPSIDIAEILEDFGMSNEIEIPEVEEVLRKSPFEAAQQTSVTVGAGSFSAYNVLFVQGLGEGYYSPEAKNLVKITGYINDFIPIVENIDMELVSMN